MPFLNSAWPCQDESSQQRHDPLLLQWYDQFHPCCRHVIAVTVIYHPLLLSLSNRRHPKMVSSPCCLQRTEAVKRCTTVARVNVVPIYIFMKTVPILCNPLRQHRARRNCHHEHDSQRPGVKLVYRNVLCACVRVIISVDKLVVLLLNRDMRCLSTKEY